VFRPGSHRQSPTALVVNAYSTLNRGDAVILDGVLNSLRAAGVQHIMVAAPKGAGEAERRLALGADEVVPMPFDLIRGPWIVRRFFVIHALYALWNLAAITILAILRPDSLPALRAYRRADLVISSGGAYLGGPRPGINLMTAYQIMLARLLKRPIIVAPITLKPMSVLVRAIIATALQGVRVFGRDESTVARLQRNGIRSKLAADLAFRSRASQFPRNFERSTDERMVVAWAPRQFGWDADAYARRIEIAEATLRVLTWFVRERDARLQIIAQSTASGLEDDHREIDRMLARLPPDVRDAADLLPPPRSLDEAMAQYARADVLYSYRLHAAILALFAGTPSLVVDYEPKVRGVLGMIGLSHWVVTSDGATDPVTVADRLFSLASGPDARDMERAIALGAELTAPFEAGIATLVRQLVRAMDRTAR
jgi:polysaccharide pyruvyl transferase WcaK-like protein